MEIDEDLNLLPSSDDINETNNAASTSKTSPSKTTVSQNQPPVTTNIKVNIGSYSYRESSNTIKSSVVGSSATPERLPAHTVTEDNQRTAVSDHLESEAAREEDLEESLSSSQSTELPTQKLSKVNCAEKIVICVDVSSEMNERRYRAKAGTSFSAMEIVKKALKLFISNKLSVCDPANKHSFAMVLMLDEALWLVDFTSDIQALFTQIDNIDCLQENDEEFDMSTLFDLILEKAKPPLISIEKDTAPPYTVRVVFIYGRSHCLPIFDSHESQNLLSGSPCFFMDIVYFHEPPANYNQAQDIFQELCFLDTRGFSYIFDFARTPTKVFDAFAKMLGHPLQRPIQVKLAELVINILLDVSTCVLRLVCLLFPRPFK
ncbi:BABAM1 [Bugula neritina]|uniref:BRISC and BRCA1-A complex member 1 n=1 Tax=Bugula neritina TaxID=10212 RepID=A0A7J7KAN8_BUGNE|nr:BABAM1 [Bugula neritina]